MDRFWEGMDRHVEQRLGPGNNPASATLTGAESRLVLTIKDPRGPLGLDPGVIRKKTAPGAHSLVADPRLVDGRA